MLLFYTFHWCRIFGAFKEGTRFLYSKHCNYLPGSGLHVAGWMALPLDQSVLAEGTSALLWSRNAAFDKLQGVCPCSTQEEEEDGTDSSSGMQGLLA